MRVIFVHGAFVRDGSWWWKPVADVLAAYGLESVAVALPSCGETPAPVTGAGPGLLEDAAALAAVIDSGDDAIIVASSYGGTVAAQGAGRPNVRHLLYISSFLPLPGQTHADVIGASDDPVPVGANPDGTLRVLDDDAAAFDERFLHDVADVDLIRGAHARLAAQSPSALMTATTTAAWQDIASTYLVCAQDRNTAPARQREQAERASRVVELPTGHHPFLSRPDLVAAEVRALADSFR